MPNTCANRGNRNQGCTSALMTYDCLAALVFYYKAKQCNIEPC